ncbi:MAG: polyprotein [Apis iflavirus 1]|nr:MAG: polyprotein [Apis iflavirus 1]
MALSFKQFVSLNSSKYFVDKKIMKTSRKPLGSLANSIMVVTAREVRVKYYKSRQAKLDYKSLYTVDYYDQLYSAYVDNRFKWYCRDMALDFNKCLYYNKNFFIKQRTLFDFGSYHGRWPTLVYKQIFLEQKQYKIEKYNKNKAKLERELKQKANRFYALRVYRTRHRFEEPIYCRQCNIWTQDRTHNHMKSYRQARRASTSDIELISRQMALDALNPPIYRATTSKIERNPSLVERLRYILRGLREKRLGIIKRFIWPSIVTGDIEMHDLRNSDAVDATYVMDNISLHNCPISQVQPEGDVEGVHGDTIIQQDHASNTVLVTNRETDTDSITPTIQRWSEYTSGDVSSQYEINVNRWLLFEQFKWSTSDTINTEKIGIRLPGYILDHFKPKISQMPNLVPFTLHRYWRGTMHIKLQVNSNKFQVGRLIMGFWYGFHEDGAAKARTHIMALSQNTHVIINAGSSNEAELIIPFNHVTPFLHTKVRRDYSDPLNLGQLHIYVMAPLRSIGVNDCSCSLYVKFTDNEFTGMIHGSLAVPEMDVIGSTISGIKAVEKLVDTILPDQNRDLPPAPQAPSYLIPTGSHSWSAGTGIAHPIHPLRLDVTGQTHYPSNVPISDEFSVKNIVSKFGLIHCITWTRDDIEQDRLACYPASPIFDYDLIKVKKEQISLYGRFKQDFDDKKYQSVQLHYYPPVGVISSCFSMWRGELEYKIEVVASQFHTGRLLVAYIPGIEDLADAQQVTVEHALASTYAIIDIQEQQTFTFVVPYIADKPWWPRRYHGITSFVDENVPGYLFIFVLNKLNTMQEVTTDVDILIYLRGGSSFEVALPAQPNVGLCFEPRIYYPIKERYQPNSGYEPCYWGHWSVLGGNLLVLRWGTLADEITQFPQPPTWPYTHVLTTYVNKSDKDAPLIHDKNPVMLVVSYDKKYFVGVPLKEYNDAIAVKIYDNMRRHQGLLNNDLHQFIAEQEDTTTNKYSSADTYWIAQHWKNNPQIQLPKKFYSKIDKTANEVLYTQSESDISEDWDTVYPEGNREDPVNIVQPGISVASMQFGFSHFGENFNDLKTLCRRYQVYKMFKFSSAAKDASQTLAIIPLLHQGLPLIPTIGNTENTFANRMRDGIIPVLLSGYRFIRGGMRIRLISSLNRGALWLQHRPNMRLRSTYLTTQVDISDEEAIFHHGYATYVQMLDINPSVELEIPMYNMGMYNYLQVPKITDTQNDVFKSLGYLHVGCFTNSTVFRGQPCVVAYSFADDTHPHVFQGFPPMLSLSMADAYRMAIPEGPNEIDNVDVLMYAEIAASKAVKEAEPEFFSDWIKRSATSAIKDSVSDVASDVRDKINEVISDAQTNNVEFIQTSFFRKIIDHLIHCSLAQNIKNVIWAFCSILIEVGIMTMDIAKRLATLLKSFYSKMAPPQSQSGDDVIHSVPEGDINMSVSDLAGGIVGLLYASVTSVFAMKYTLSSQTDILKKGVKMILDIVPSISRNGLVITTFISKIVSILQWLFNIVASKVIPQKEQYENLQTNKEFINKWYEECQDLLRVHIKRTYSGDPLYSERVSMAADFGAVLLQQNFIAYSDTKLLTIIQSMYDKISKLQEELTQIGENPHVRREPFTIYMYGEPGIGKSYLQHEVCSKLLDAANIRYSNAMTCVINPASNYWDQCDHQPVLCVDDMWAIRSPGNILDHQLITMFQVCSSVVLTPPKAKLEEKTMRYNPYIFWINSNYDFPDIPGANAEAIWRRRNILVQAKLQYGRDSAGKIVEGVHVQGCPHCQYKEGQSIDLSTIPRKWLSDYHHLCFSIHANPRDPLAGYGQFMSYTQLMAELTSRFCVFNRLESEKFKQRCEHVAASRQAELGEAIKSQNIEEIYDEMLHCPDKRNVMLYALGDDVPNTYVGAIKQRLALFYSTLRHLSPKKSQPEGDVVVNNPETQTLWGTYFNPESYTGLSINKTQIEKFRKHFKDQLAYEFKYHKRSEIMYWLEPFLAWDQFKWLSPEAKLAKEHFENSQKLVKPNDKQFLYRYWSQLYKCQHCYLDFSQLFYRDEEYIYQGTTAQRLAYQCPDKCILDNPIGSIIYYEAWYDASAVLRSAILRQRPRCVPAYWQDQACVSIRSVMDTICESIKYVWIEYLCPTAKKMWDFFTTWQNWIWPILETILLGFVYVKGFSRGRAHGIPVGVERCNDRWNNFLDKNEDCLNPAHDRIWGAPESRPYENENRNVRKKVQRTIPKPVQAQFKNEQIQTCITRIKDNTVWVRVCYGQKERRFRCVIIRGRQMLFLRHYMECARAIADAQPCTFTLLFDRESKYYQDGPGIPIDFLNCERCYYGDIEQNGFNSNYGVMNLPVRFPECKSLLPFIAYSTKHQYVNNKCIVVEPGSGIHHLPLKIDAHPTKVVTEGGITSEVYMNTTYTYPHHGRGVCGSVVLADGLDTPIIGMHVAGHISGSEYGIAEPLYRDMFEELPSDKRVKYVDIVEPLMDDAEFAKINLETSIFPVGKMPSNYAHCNSEVSMYIPSEIHGTFPVDTEPNPLSKKDPRCADHSASPLVLGCAKHGMPTKQFPQQMIADAAEDFENLILTKCLPIRSFVQPLDLQTAICGDKNIPEFMPLRWSTSPGFPLSATRPPNTSGKRYLFDLEETVDGLILKGMDEDLERQLTLQSAMRKRGIKPFTLFTDCLKDTCLPKEKCLQPGKTRIFSISPVQFTIAFRQYYADYMASYMRHRMDLEHAIGIDVNSDEWTRIANIMQSKGPNCVAGDYSNFGPGLNMEVCEAAFHIIIRWLLYHLHPCEDKEEFERVANILAYEVMTSYHLVIDLVYRVAAGLPSGSPITVILNDMVNAIYIRMAWKAITGRTYADMYEHIAMFRYGDDVFINISEEIQDTFNTVTLAKFFAAYDIKFTDADKSGNLVPYRPFAACTFLKRSFLKHPTRPGKYLAALDKRSIQGTTNWIHKKNNPIEATIENCKQACELAYGWGPDYYEYVRQTLIKACRDKLRENLIIPTWREIDSRINEGLKPLICIPEMPDPNQYSNWTSQLDVFECSSWYEQSALLRTLNRIRQINFAIQEQRTEAFAMLNNLNTCAPFARDKQFANGKNFICEDIGDFPQKLMKLRMALSFKEKDKDSESKAIRNGYNDTILSFYNIINSIIQEIREGHYVYNRDKFEKEFNVSWS